MFGRFGRRLAVLGVAPLAAIAVVPAMASATAVGPDQGFVGAEYSATGQPGVVDVVCAGPAATGHPAAGQSVEVFLVLPPVATTVGFTGSAADSIEADLIWSTTGPGPVTVVTYLTTFTSYGVKMPIPTSIIVPCSGKGVISFTPSPTSPTARASTVDVTFVSPGV